jgi:lipoyl(octanoyl) transferase
MESAQVNEKTNKMFPEIRFALHDAIVFCYNKSNSLCTNFIRRLPMKLNVVNLGRIEYDKALDIQEKLLAKCQNQGLDDTLLLLEHPAVLTMGIRAEKSNIFLSQEQLQAYGVRIYEINRGGDVTYHGPGQIVGYPIFHLSRHGKSIKDFVLKIQEVFIRLLTNEYGISPHREDKKYMGVWVGNDKITAIGIAVQHWVAMHGFAFNVNTDLSHFNWINPCGLTGRGVTSLQKLTGTTQDMDHLYQLTAQYFCEVFHMEENICTIESLIG